MPPPPHSRFAIEENARFLYSCIIRSDYHSIDFNLVARDFKINPPAARMRWTRLRQAYVKARAFEDDPHEERERERRRRGPRAAADKPEKSAGMDEVEPKVEEKKEEDAEQGEERWPGWESAPAEYAGGFAETTGLGYSIVQPGYAPAGYACAAGEVPIDPALMAEGRERSASSVPLVELAGRGGGVREPVVRPVEIAAVARGSVEREVGATIQRLKSILEIAGEIVEAIEGTPAPSGSPRGSAPPRTPSPPYHPLPPTPRCSRGNTPVVVVVVSDDEEGGVGGEEDVVEAEEDGVADVAETVEVKAAEMEPEETAAQTVETPAEDTSDDDNGVITVAAAPAARESSDCVRVALPARRATPGAHGRLTVREKELKELSEMEWMREVQSALKKGQTGRALRSRADRVSKPGRRRRGVYS